MSRINRSSQRREELREEAAVRANERASRTNKQQLDLLDNRLGDGIGAFKERKVLNSLPNDSKNR
jgi:hypothetical protein